MVFTANTKRYALYTKVKRRLRNTAEWSYRMSVPSQYVRQWKSRKEKGDVGDIQTVFAGALSGME